MGDASDNIPGVPGIGEKTALKLLWDFETVEGVLANADKVSGKKVQSNLKEFADQAILSKSIATMVTEVPLAFLSDDFVYRRSQAAKVLPVFQKYELNNVTRLWHERHKDDEGPLSESVETLLEVWPERTLTDEGWLAQIEEWQAEKTPLTLACRYEGTGLQGGRWIEWGVATLGETFILIRQEAFATVLEAWLKLMGSDQVPKTLTDSKTVALLLASEGIDLKGLALDTFKAHSRK